MTMSDQDRLFVAHYPEGVVYADRAVKQYGDYKRLAFQSYATLELELKFDCPPSLAVRIRGEARNLQARRGELIRISTTGQTRLLGSHCTKLCLQEQGR